MEAGGQQTTRGIRAGGTDRDCKQEATHGHELEEAIKD